MPPRRSTRRATARKSYTEDAFEALGLEDEEDDVESNAEPTSSKDAKGKSRKRRRDESDEEFNEEAAAAASADEEEYMKEEEEEPDDGDEDEPSHSVDGGSDVEAEPAAKLSKSSIAARGSRTPTSTAVRQRRDDGSILFKPNDTHTRGAYNPSEHVGKSMHIKLSFGVDNRDLLAAAAARTQWSLGVDATFPTRESLERAPGADEFGPGATHGVSAEELEREATEAWDWYYDDNYGPMFRKRQRVEKTDKERAEQKFLYRSRKTSHKVIYGPSENLSTTHLRPYESLNVGDAWKYRDETHKLGKNTDASKKKGKGRAKNVTQSSASPATIDAVADGSSEAPTEQRRKNRYGWILNLSGKVQALEWAPNQDGLTQYLAVSVPISAEQEKQHDPPEPPVASRAFSASPAYPGAIQIWSFDAEERKDGMIKTIDVNSKPKLRQVLCMDFGHIRKIRWCGFPRRRRDKEIDSSKHGLGLLGCVFSDGRTRVFDIKVDRDAETPEYLHVKSAAFTAIPSPTISTCMAWLSPTDIVIGCANGCVAVYNIATFQTTPKSGGQEDEPVPYIYLPIHSTYLTNIETAYPQHPHLISTVSMDGNTRLTSLLDTVKDVVDTQRQRLGIMQISYYPHLQAFASSDENDFVRGLSIRRFYTATSIGRIPSTITTIASGSRWHPSVMVGCTEGSIWCFNPLRRFMHAKESHFHARWFLHEWAAGKDDQTPNTSRFTDELEVESLSLVRHLKDGTKIVNGVMTITIYDEEQHVVAVNWNPNQHCAGWAAAGMGSGLVRVEDLAMFH